MRNIDLENEKNFENRKAAVAWPGPLGLVESRGKGTHSRHYTIRETPFNTITL